MENLTPVAGPKTHEPIVTKLAWGGAITSGTSTYKQNVNRITGFCFLPACEVAHEGDSVTYFGPIETLLHVGFPQQRGVRGVLEN